MNERIRELAEQAESSRLEYNSATMMTERIQEFDKEKFAELIVRECAGVGYDASYYECALNVSNKIKEHFGVEE
jgi:hypothetical protein